MPRSSGGAGVAARPPRALQPLVVTPTPASSTSTVSTAALDSPSSSSSESESESESESDDTHAADRRGFLARSRASHSSRHAKPRTNTKRKPSSRASRKAAQEQHRQRRPLPHVDIDLEFDLERGGAGAAHEWQVVREFRAPCGGATDSGAVLQLVALKRANFGVRWRDEGAANAPPPCMVGPHWWLMGSTFTVFLGAVLVVTALTTPRAGFGEAIMGVLLSSACLSMYALVGCSNPGIVERIEDPPDDTYSYCDHCDSYRPEGALHCMDCRVCVEGYDHHCPWTGKCIGRGNVRYFYAWLFFLVLAFVYEVIEFTTYILPPEDQPTAGPTFFDDDDAGGANVIRTVGPHF